MGGQVLLDPPTALLPLLPLRHGESIAPCPPRRPLGADSPPPRDARDGSDFPAGSRWTNGAPGSVGVGLFLAEFPALGKARAAVSTGTRSTLRCGPRRGFRPPGPWKRPGTPNCPGARPPRQPIARGFDPTNAVLDKGYDMTPSTRRARSVGFGLSSRSRNRCS
jgi:hypothetical protein